MSQLSLKNVNKIYPNGFHAVHDFCLDIKDKEFIVFVGPSGCGKSTTLRMIAGLENISSGEFQINGVRANEKGPRDRGVAMVFQSYALYPHFSVYDNLSFGLTLQGIDEETIEEKVNATAKILGLTDYLDRKPRELSGGQRQRVAVGRAIIRKVDIFLMDEPLSNLDAKQRVTMRSEITQIHRETKATTIYVTHDQTEAMTMADFRKGHFPIRFYLSEKGYAWLQRYRQAVEKAFRDFETSPDNSLVFLCAYALENSPYGVLNPAVTLSCAGKAYDKVKNLKTPLAAVAHETLARIHAETGNPEKAVALQEAALAIRKGTHLEQAAANRLRYYKELTAMKSGAK